MCPSWIGLVYDEEDIACVLHRAIEGKIPLCTRRPQEEEHHLIIKNGAVIIYEEHSSGMKRWTDGRNWSPSRTAGPFLVYREIERKDKNAPDLPASPGQDDYELVPVSQSWRDLVGSLIGCHDYLSNGLVKRTATIPIGSQIYHVITYFDANNYGFLTRPKHNPLFKGAFSMDKLKCTYSD
jgi:Gti1/Pac2 family transcription factor